MSSRLNVPIAIVVGGIIIAVAVYASMPKNPSARNGNASLVRPVGTMDHILGNPVAPVKIVEYADFDSEYSKNFNDTLQQVIADAGAQGQVAWVYREFPIIENHPNALSHARAAECIAEVAGNDAFWKFATALFANQPVDPSKYGVLAGSAGVSGERFATCYSTASTTETARIMADRQNALDVGAVGAPYSLILVSGKAPIVMEGAYSYDAVKQLITQALGN